MKLIIMASGSIAIPQTYDLESNAAIPNVGDTVMISGKPFEAYARIFDFGKNPSEVSVLCKHKGA